MSKYEIKIECEFDIGYGCSSAWAYCNILYDGSGKFRLETDKFGECEIGKWNLGRFGTNDAAAVDECEDIVEKSCKIIELYISSKTPAWWRKMIAIADANGYSELKCRLPKRKGFCTWADVVAFEE